MKKRIVIGMFCFLPCLLIADDKGCDYKLNALIKTLFRVGQTASQATTSLQTYQTDCCESCADILRSDRYTRAPQCFCTTTTIYEPTVLIEAGSYCLASDITGDISTSDVQVAIDLKGHVVQGNVGVGEHGYVHNGTVTGSLVLPSYSSAERVTVGRSLQGAMGFNVLVKDLVLTNTTSSAISNFNSLILERCSLESKEEGSPLFTIDSVANLVMRDSKVKGDLWVDFNNPPLLEILAIDNSQIAGELFVYANSSLSSAAVRDSSCTDFHLEFITTSGSPSVLLNGFSCSSLVMNGVSENPHPTSRIMIDECDCGNIDLRDLSNIRCQNTLVRASEDFSYQACSVNRCHNGVFENVSVFSNGGGDKIAFSIFDCSNLLFKRCFATAEDNTAFMVQDLGYTSTAISFDHCVVKGSRYGFYVAGEKTTGATIDCIADGCLGGFVPQWSNVSTVFAKNVSCLNTMNYGAGEQMPPYYDISYTVTASSWRNISL